MMELRPWCEECYNWHWPLEECYFQSYTSDNTSGKDAPERLKPTNLPRKKERINANIFIFKD